MTPCTRCIQLRSFTHSFNDLLPAMTVQCIKAKEKKSARSVINWIEDFNYFADHRIVFVLYQIWN